MPTSMDNKPQLTREQLEALVVQIKQLMPVDYEPLRQAIRSSVFVEEVDVEDVEEHKEKDLFCVYPCGTGRPGGRRVVSVGAHLFFRNDRSAVFFADATVDVPPGRFVGAFRFCDKTLATLKDIRSGEIPVDAHLPRPNVPDEYFEEALCLALADKGTTFEYVTDLKGPIADNQVFSFDTGGAVRGGPHCDFIASGYRGFLCTFADGVLPHCVPDTFTFRSDKAARSFPDVFIWVREAMRKCTTVDWEEFHTVPCTVRSKDKRTKHLVDRRNIGTFWGHLFLVQATKTAFLQTFSDDCSLPAYVGGECVRYMFNDTLAMADHRSGNVHWSARLFETDAEIEKAETEAAKYEPLRRVVAGAKRVTWAVYKKMTAASLQELGIAAVTHMVNGTSQMECHLIVRENGTADLNLPAAQLEPYGRYQAYCFSLSVVDELVKAGLTSGSVPAEARLPPTTLRRDMLLHDLRETIHYSRPLPLLPADDEEFEFFKGNYAVGCFHYFKPQPWTCGNIGHSALTKDGRLFIEPKAQVSGPLVLLSIDPKLRKRIRDEPEFVDIEGIVLDAQFEWPEKRMLLQDTTVSDGRGGIAVGPAVTHPNVVICQGSAGTTVIGQ